MSPCIQRLVQDIFGCYTAITAMNATLPAVAVSGLVCLRCPASLKVLAGISSCSVAVAALTCMLIRLLPRVSGLQGPAAATTSSPLSTLFSLQHISHIQLFFTASSKPRKPLGEKIRKACFFCAPASTTFLASSCSVTWVPASRVHWMDDCDGTLGVHTVACWCPESRSRMSSLGMYPELSCARHEARRGSMLHFVDYQAERHSHVTRSPG